MQKIPFKPLLDRILLQEIKQETEHKTKAGLILLDTGNERPKQSKVIATGPGTPGNKTQIQPGQIVLHGKSAGFKLKINESEFIIIRESDIFGVID